MADQQVDTKGIMTVPVYGISRATGQRVNEEISGVGCILVEDRCA